MTIEEILVGESKNVEFKENLPEKSIKYMKSVVAFDNQRIGKLQGRRTAWLVAFTNSSQNN